MISCLPSRIRHSPILCQEYLKYDRPLSILYFSYFPGAYCIHFLAKCVHKDAHKFTEQCTCMVRDLRSAKLVLPSRERGNIPGVVVWVDF